jgi:hypothetical protein
MSGMVQVLAFMLVYTIGMIVGALAVIAGTRRLDRRQDKVKVEQKRLKQELVEKLIKKRDETLQRSDSIKDRLMKASQIAQAQQDLRLQVEMLSDSDLHAHRRNGLVIEIAELERRKLDILKTILAEGFNPTITLIQDSGDKSEILLSEYVRQQQEITDMIPRSQHQPNSNTVGTAGAPTAASGGVAAATQNPNEPRKVGKFFVYKGGKDDGTIH